MNSSLTFQLCQENHECIWIEKEKEIQFLKNSLEH